MPAPFLNGVLGCAAAQEKCFARLRKSAGKEQPSRTCISLSLLRKIPSLPQHAVNAVNPHVDSRNGLLYNSIMIA